MTLLAFLFCNSFGYVFLKAWQQQNVIGRHYLWLGPVSYGMALAEVFGVSAYVESDNKWVAGFAIGTGAWIGCVLAMKFHERLTGHNWHKPPDKGDNATPLASREL